MDIGSDIKWSWTKARPSPFPTPSACREPQEKVGGIFWSVIHITSGQLWSDLNKSASWKGFLNFWAVMLVKRTETEGVFPIEIRVQWS